MAEPANQANLPGLDFSTFIVSLATSAQLHLGIIEAPEGIDFSPNKLEAKHTIDLLEILESKTKGNLTGDEEKLLGHLLYELRMAFLEKKEA